MKWKPWKPWKPTTTSKYQLMKQGPWHINSSLIINHSDQGGSAGYGDLSSLRKMGTQFLPLLGSKQERKLRWQGSNTGLTHCRNGNETQFLTVNILKDIISDDDSGLCVVHSEAIFEQATVPFLAE